MEIAPKSPLWILIIIMLVVLRRVISQILKSKGPPMRRGVHVSTSTSTTSSGGLARGGDPDAADYKKISGTDFGDCATCSHNSSAQL